MALKDHFKDRYGSWAGNNAGFQPDFSRCAETVSSGGWHYKQCTRKNGHGPDAAYCKQHSPESVAARKEAAKELYEKQTVEWSFRFHGKKFARALKAIADGDNDPRSTAKETLGDLYDKI